MYKDNKAKIGMRSKLKGGQYERDIAKSFQKRYNIELRRTPQSGGFSKKVEKAEDFRGDIVCIDKDIKLNFHIECKNQKVWKLKDWLEQAEGDCPKDKVPIVIFHKHQSNKDYVCLSLEDFLNIVEKDKVFVER